MKNLFLASTFFATMILIGCSNNDQKSYEASEDSPELLQYRKGLQNDDNLLKKLKDIQITALGIWSKYHTKDTLRWKKIRNSLEAVSMVKLESIERAGSRNNLKLNYLGQQSVTTLQLLVCDPTQINLLFRNADSLSSGKMIMLFKREEAGIENAQLPPQARKAIIYANSFKLNEYSIHALAYCLIHELTHVYQYIYLPNIKEDEREPDAWNIQLQSLKANMYPTQLKEFQQHAVVQRKRKYNPDTFFQENEDWLKSMFGQAQMYAELFALECYGFNKVFKEAYKKIKN